MILTDSMIVEPLRLILLLLVVCEWYDNIEIVKIDDDSEIVLCVEQHFLTMLLKNFLFNFQD